MILILSDDQDQSTNKVARWLKYYHADFIRINETDKIAIEKIHFDAEGLASIVVSINGNKLDLTAIKAYWYRRGWLNCADQFAYKFTLGSKAVDEKVISYLNEERNELISFIHFYLQKTKKNISSFLTAFNRKVSYQFMASMAGLKVPETVVVTNGEELQSFFDQDIDGVVTKSINESLGFNIEHTEYFTRTYEVRKEDIIDESEIFFPTLFQKKIEKLIELRIFVLHDEMYSMAIFSQQNERTKLDFRNYDWSRPNRTVPFQLPFDINKKVRHFMKSINLNCGSIDMILTQQNDYVFLEVNPVGQLGMVSSPCNYQLESRIAQYLSEG